MLPQIFAQSETKPFSAKALVDEALRLLIQHNEKEPEYRLAITEASVRLLILYRYPQFVKSKVLVEQIKKVVGDIEFATKGTKHKLIQKHHQSMEIYNHRRCLTVAEIVAQIAHTQQQSLDIVPIPAEISEQFEKQPWSQKTHRQLSA
ncbi:hypothetical protein ACQ4M3_24335 [Leptolyngbya sp. AN03gr2]|uniref:hypothetical protein n=1 Tax=Leptolyngbya sp. AN03gr2 TaxID=3423364 RepID=UPI003D313EAA